MRRLPRSLSEAVLPREAWVRARLRTSSGRSSSITLAHVRSEIERAPDESGLDVDCVVFSKNRPMQLDACLRSIVRNAPYRGSITVVYRATSDRFREGYAQLSTDERVLLVEQSRDFKADLVDVLDDVGELIVFHTDDDVFFRSTPCAPLLPSGCATFSLRLGENTTYCYPLAREQRVPLGGPTRGILSWDWSRAELDFAYPMSLDGHIFDADVIRQLVRDAGFCDPNDLERELHLRRHRMPRLMLSFARSCVVAVPVNVVTDSIVNRSGGDPELSPEALNERFLEGERIDLEALDFTRVRAAHQEVPLVFSSRREQ